MRKLMVDAGLCTGCRYCEAVCSMAHSRAGVCNPRKARIQVHSDPRNGVDTPVVCRMCAAPACVKACPVSVLSRDDASTGTIRVDQEQCTGCLACLEACSFGAIVLDEDTGTVVICDLCGGDPMCVKFCRTLPHIGASALSYVTPREFAERCRKKVGE